MNGRPVWIDCDPGVDDAVALLLAHRLPELEILGISTEAGNVPQERAAENALKICALAGVDTPVYRGAEAPIRRPYHPTGEFHGVDGLGGVALPPPDRAPEDLPAWDALYAAAQAHAGALELVTLGPLTNLAIAFAKYPKLPGLLRRIVMMGGSATRGNCTPCAEFNVHTDPEAAQAVFRSGAPVVMCGLEATENAYLTPEELKTLAKTGAIGRFVEESSRGILQKNLAQGHPGWCAHDVCPIVYLVRPELFSCREAGVFVETRASLTLGKTVTDLFSDKKFEMKNALVALDTDRPAFAAFVTEILGG